MPSSSTLFLPGMEEVHQAIEKARRGAQPEWMQLAHSAISDLAAVGEPFTTDDVWNRLGSKVPREPRALGPVVTDAERNGQIKKTGVTLHSSRRKINHGRKLTQWIGVESESA